MQQWEYLRLARRRESMDDEEWKDSTIPGGHPTTMEELGIEGWELVSVVPQTYHLRGVYTALTSGVLREKDEPFDGWAQCVHVTFLFKRPIEQ